jgi:hypothetical protein
MIVIPISHDFPFLTGCNVNGVIMNKGGAVMIGLRRMMMMNHHGEQRKRRMTRNNDRDELYRVVISSLLLYLTLNNFDEI